VRVFVNSALKLQRHIVGDFAHWVMSELYSLHCNEYYSGKFYDKFYQGLLDILVLSFTHKFDFQIWHWDILS